MLVSKFYTSTDEPFKADVLGKLRINDMSLPWYSAPRLRIAKPTRAKTKRFEEEHEEFFLYRLLTNIPSKGTR
jgi:hypothetical protein